LVSIHYPGRAELVDEQAHLMLLVGEDVFDNGTFIRLIH
jgi:hypothetical protein